MHKMLETYFNNVEKEQKEIYENQKRKFLISNGFYEKVYSDAAQYNSDYPYCERLDDGKTVWFRTVPIEATDEEYERLKAIIETKNHANKPTENISVQQPIKNKIASILRVVAIITFIVGFICGIVFGTQEVTHGVYYTYTTTEFSFGAALIYWLIAFLSGISLLGFAEIIDLLQRINYNVARVK